MSSPQHTHMLFWFQDPSSVNKKWKQKFRKIFINKIISFQPNNLSSIQKNGAHFQKNNLSKLNDKTWENAPEATSDDLNKWMEASCEESRGGVMNEWLIKERVVEEEWWWWWKVLWMKA